MTQICTACQGGNTRVAPARTRTLVHRSAAWHGQCATEGSWRRRHTCPRHPLPHNEGMSRVGWGCMQQVRCIAPGSRPMHVAAGALHAPSSLQTSSPALAAGTQGADQHRQLASPLKKANTCQQQPQKGLQVWCMVHATAPDDSCVGCASNGHRLLAMSSVSSHPTLTCNPSQHPAVVALLLELPWKLLSAVDRAAAASSPSNGVVSTAAAVAE